MPTFPHFQPLVWGLLGEVPRSLLSPQPVPGESSPTCPSFSPPAPQCTLDFARREEVGVFISFGCFNNLPQMQWLKTQAFVLLAGLEVRRP